VRLGALNTEDDHVWTVDARDQTLVFPDGSAKAAQYAQAGGGGPPRIALRRGQRGFVDLFFPGWTDDPPWTSLRWRIRTGASVSAGATVFGRLLEPEADYAPYWPAEYLGGELVAGGSWCAPRWGAEGWLEPFSPYRRYRYAPAA